jgi:hypothetical protein
MYLHLENKLTVVKLLHTINLSEVSTNEALDEAKKYLGSLHHDSDINSHNTIITYKSSNGND